MTSQLGSLQDRQVLAAARRYKRQGYSVAVPKRGDPVPSFLQGFAPDLIAERDGDHVVVEVKCVDAIPGSNELIALAETVARERDWRFELISVPFEGSAISSAVDSNDEVDRLLTHGFTRAAFLVSYAMIENLLGYAATINEVRLPKGSTATLARELAVTGVISGDAFHLIEQASDTRNALVHRLGPAPDAATVQALVALAARLRREILEEKAA